MLTNFNYNNPNFGAKLVNTSKLNKERWERIGKKFEDKTNDFPNDKLYIGRLQEEKDCYRVGLSNKKSNNRPFMIVEGSIIGKLLACRDDNHIAAKLTKIFNNLKREELYLEKNRLLYSDIQSGKKALSAEDVDKIIEKIDKLDDNFNKNSYNLFKNDSDLRPLAEQFNIFDNKLLPLR